MKMLWTKVVSPRQLLERAALVVTLGVLIAPSAVWSQVKKPGSDINQAPPKSKTRLEVIGVRGNSGASMTIHSADVLTFRWSTSETNAFYAFWYVFDTPFNFGDKVVGAQKSPLTSAQVGGTSTNGFADTFTINFEVFANHTPPQSPKRYYVYVVTNTIDGKPALPSGPVIITYSRSPGWTPSELGSEYCSLSIQHPYHLERCYLKFLNPPVIDPTLNRVDIPSGHSVHVLVKSAAAGKKYQIDCSLAASGTKPFKIISVSGIFTESIPQTGGPSHAIFTFESKNTDWMDFRIENENGMIFFHCTVTNIK